MKRILLMLVFLLSLAKTGYTQTPQAIGDTTKEVYDLSLEELMNIVVVVASKSEEKISDAPGVITVLTKDEITRFGGVTLASLLERVSGIVHATTYISDRSVLSVRGDQISANSSHVLLLINGRPVRESLEGGINSEIYESFPVNIIKRIEVIKGPGSVLYGTNAFSGVINVVTEKADKNGASITGLGGQGNAYGSLVDVKIKRGDLNIVAAGSILKKPTWSVNFDRFRGTNLYTKTIDIPNDGIGTFLNASYKGLSCMSSYNQWNNFGATTRGSGNVHWKKFFNNISYDTKIANSWQTSANVGYTQSKLDADSFPKFHRNSYEMLAEWTNFVTLSAKSKLVVGGLYMLTKGKEYNTLTGAEVVSTDAKRNAYGGYAQADYSLFSKLKLIAGIQANKIENVSIGIVPRVGLILQAVNDVNIKILYGQAFRAPSLNEVALNAPTLKGNKNLSPEKVGTFDASIGYTRDKMHFNVNYFYSSLTDIIVVKRLSPTAVGNYENLGGATIQGGEFEGKVHLSKQWYVTTSGLYQQSKDKDGNKNITPIPSLVFKSGISYQWEKGITASLFYIYQGKLDDKFESKINPSPIRAFNKLDAHLNCNINQLANLKFKTIFNVFAHGDNLLNQTVWAPMWGSAAGNSIPFIQGRFMYAGLNVQF